MLIMQDNQPAYNPQELIKIFPQQDSLQGYKTQNKFLNKEILELSALRRNAERRERDLMAKVSQDGYILPFGGREETVFKWMCFPNHHAGKNAATVSKRVLGVSSTFCLWVTKKHCHIWPSPSVCEEFQMKCITGFSQIKVINVFIHAVEIQFHI